MSINFNDFAPGGQYYGWTLDASGNLVAPATTQPDFTTYSSVPWDTTRPADGGEEYTPNATYQDAMAWATTNLFNDLYNPIPQGVDLSSSFGPNWQDTWDVTGGHDYSNIFGDSWNTWTQGVKDGTTTDLTGLNVTPQTLDAYFKQLGTQNEYTQAISQYWPTLVTGPNGETMVREFAKEEPEPGFLDTISDMIVPASMALVGGIGGADILGQLGGVSDAFGGTGTDFLSGGTGSDVLNSGIDWTSIDQSIADLGTGAFEAENLGTAGSVLDAGALTDAADNLYNPSADSLTPTTPTPSNLPQTPSMPPADPSGTTTTTETGTPNWDPAVTPAVTSAGLLDRILNGTATASDWASILGTVGSTALGVYGANQQADALTKIAEDARADRQPFLDKSLALLAGGPEAYAAGEGASSLAGVLRGLSVNGNPFGNATSMALAGDSVNRNYQNALTGYANLGLGGQDSRNQLLASAAGAQSGALDSLGYGLNSLTQDNSLNGLLKKLGLGSINSGFNLG